jgi:hypothetical protein
MIITEHRLRRLFADRGFKVHEIRCNRHWVARVARDSGGPSQCRRFAITERRVRFPRNFAATLRRAEREARSRT